MMDASISSGLPWLEFPIVLHSSRANTCTLTAAQCAYRAGFWRNWYEDDHVYGYGTIIFMCTILLGFVLSRIGTIARRSSDSGKTTISARLSAAIRILSSKQVRLGTLGWYSPPIGLMLIGVAGTLFFACMTLGPQPYYWPNTASVSYGGSPPIATRSGWMAVALLPFVMILATKSNPISTLTGISHEKLQVLHRWTSWTMFILAMIHTFPFIIVHISKGDMMYQWTTNLEYWTGVAALIPQGWLNIMSIGCIRNRYYETFKLLHLVAVILFVFFLFVHCDFTLTSVDYMIAAITMYVATLLVSWTRTFIYGIHYCTATLLSDGYVRLEISSRTVTWKAGQHVFLRFPTAALGIQAFTSHPFTIANLWLEGTERCSLQFYVKPTTSANSLSRKLQALTTTHQDEGIRLPVIIDGPYGGISRSHFLAADSILLICGGSGISFILPVLELALSTRSIICVAIAVKSNTSAIWVAQRIRSLVDDCGGSVALHCDIYVTSDERHNVSYKEGVRSEAQSVCEGIEKGDLHIADSLKPPQTEKEEGRKTHTTYHTGRPALRETVDNSCSRAPGDKLCIAVCGPEGMQFDVREAVTSQQLRIARSLSGPREIHLHTEGFSW